MLSDKKASLQDVIAALSQNTYLTNELTGRSSWTLTGQPSETSNLRSGELQALSTGLHVFSNLQPYSRDVGSAAARDFYA